MADTAPTRFSAIDAAVLSGLLPETECAISIYVSPEPPERDQRSPEARLRNLIDEAEIALVRRGLDPRRTNAMLAPLREFGTAADFARHRDPGLALFVRFGREASGQDEDGAGDASEQFASPTLTVLPLPLAVPDSVMVGADPHLKPLLPILALNQRFNILALSKSDIRLLNATPFTWTERPVEALTADAQASLDSRTGAEADTLGDARKALIMADPRRLEWALHAALLNDNAPVILAADPHVAGNFAREVRLPNLHPTVLHLNPFALRDSELHHKAVQLLQPSLSADLDDFIDQVNARLGTAEPTVAIRLEEILTAAQEGRVDGIVVAANESLWGKFQPGATLIAHGTPGPDDTDLLNQAALLVLRHGGRAYALPRERLPRQVPAAATLRF